MSSNGKSAAAANERTSEGLKPSGQMPDQKMAPHPSNGDQQTLDLVVRHLCKEFDLEHYERMTYSGVVESLHDKMTSRVTYMTQAREPALEQPTFRPGAETARDANVRRAGYPSPGVTVEAIPPYHDALYDILEGFTKTTDFSAPSALDILRVCLELSAFLMEKNKAYGDSALKPLRIMSTADPAELIRVRMDDKLSRLFRGEAAGEDVVKDLVGYWVLMRVAEKRTEQKTAR